MKKTEKQNKNLRVNMTRDGSIAKSANIVRVTSTGNDEMILDFVFTHPQDIEGDIQIGHLISRVVLPKKVAKQFSEILVKHLKKG